METKPIEVYSEATNYNVIRSPNRTHPALVVQLDNFMGMYHFLSSARAALNAHDLSAVRDELDCLDEMMEGFLKHYETVISQHGLKMSTPWPGHIPPREE